jgi:hypothetical protein
VKASVLCLLLAGCFDVEQVVVDEPRTELPLRMIDDFNDDVDNSVRQPTDPSFEPWRCFGTNGARVVSCDIAPGIVGTGRAIRYDLQDFADGKRDYQGADLITVARDVIDFSRYESITFSVALEQDVAPESTIVEVSLICGALGDVALVVSRRLGILPGVGFFTYETPLATFRQPGWQWEHGLEALDETSCLTQVDGLSLYVQPEIADGERAAATAVVDEIYAQ